ncbi:nucleotidyltransferase domain-containing protein [Acetivibrio mesophilus]|uniref:Nucleotidyltransferase n=1 Tax=Acetivibrio mesophilus TaxID=2487273 RepID=A0A4V1K1Z6_9FIRM|nr:nucleotidyltransferase family protein [Acetivibrio mesophilus]ODM27036.1 hypothetical protein A7W90_12910 [Clostridium sp. Bc-iso-3]RXE58519.1 hypothetical protein EFD62_12105 [Acetivibrio mesophilus]HHV28800.1 nucleotidyltransferase family protein [Clostridium sp.]
MPQTIHELSNERKLTILCSKGTLNETDVEMIKSIVSNRLDWKDILYQGINHRTLNMMYYHFKNLGLLDKIEKEIIKVMKNECKVYELRNQTYFNEIKNIFDRFNENGIKAAILKGNFLAAKVYPSIETRTFNDLDFLIDVKDSDKVVSVLEDAGYIQGEFNEYSGEIIPGTKKQKLLYRAATHELMECLKKTDNPFVPVIRVDLNFEVLWKGNCPYKIETAELLERAIPVDIGGATTYILDREDFLIQLACHLYKEAALINWINELRDLKVYKFADIALYIEKFSDEINWNKLIDFCRDKKCEKILYYAFHFVNLMYEDIVPEYVMKALEPEDKGYLDEYGVEKEKPFKWNYDFFTRIFESDRILEVDQDATKIRFKEAKKESGII